MSAAGQTGSPESRLDNLQLYFAKIAGEFFKVFKREPKYFDENKEFAAERRPRIIFIQLGLGLFVCLFVNFHLGISMQTNVSASLSRPRAYLMTLS